MSRSHAEQQDSDLDVFMEDNDTELCIDLRGDDNSKKKQKRNKNESESHIQVVVRKRPMSDKEVSSGDSDIVSMDRARAKVTICEQRLKVDLTKYTQYHDFTYDHCFDESAQNDEIYELCVRPLLDTLLSSGKATCFGYGQSGSGKTHTLLGSETASGARTGLYAMAVRDLFDTLRTVPQPTRVIVSFFEIYGSKLFDLLAERKQILCREDGKQKVNIVGLRRVECASAELLLRLISAGNEMRQTGSTGANNDSSRSHAILSIDVVPIRGRISFIDLAGSERGADTMNNDKQTRIEGAEINKSLLALKECIRALDQRATHKPFRGSKLTQVLKESFVGNSRTVMIATIAPNSSSCENTLNTLRYAYRVKELGPSKTLSKQRSEPNLTVARNLSRPQSAAANVNKHSKKKRKIAEEPQRPRSSNEANKANKCQQPMPMLPPLMEPEPSRSSQQPQPQPMPIATQVQLNQLKQDLSKKQLIRAHRKHIDEFMVLIKEDMQLLKQFDKNQCESKEYETALLRILEKQASAILDYKAKVFQLSTTI
jgi:kinesin family protein 2/24